MQMVDANSIDARLQRAECITSAHLQLLFGRLGLPRRLHVFDEIPQLAGFYVKVMIDVVPAVNVRGKW